MVKTLGMGLGLALAALVAAAAPAVSQEKQKIRIATSSASIPAGPARIANAMGLFEKYGLDATATPMDAGAVASAALLSGSIQFVSTGPSDVVVAQARGQKLVVVSNAYRGFAATVVISKAAAEKSGVSPNAPVAARLKALDGLTIASPSATSTFTVAVKTATEAAGAKVKFTYMSQPAMVAAMSTGQIDGFTVSAPYYVQPVAAGLGVIWMNGPKGDFPRANAPANSSVIITRQDYAEANPELVKKVDQVFRDLWKASAERPAEVKAAIAKVWPELDAKTIDAVFEVEVASFKASPVTVDDMAHEIAFMKLGGLNLPEVDKLDPRALIFPRP